MQNQQIQIFQIKRKIPNKFEIVRLQVLISLALNFKDLKYSHTEIDCLTYLALSDEIKINPFCLMMVQKGVYKHKQSARNFISALLNEDSNIVLKNEKKEISINLPNLIVDGSFVINYFLGHKE